MPWAPYSPITVASNAYATAADLTLTFEPNEFVFVNTSTDAGNQIAVSFNGVTDHIVLIKNTPLESFRAATRQGKVWFRRFAYVAGTASVSVMANSYV